MANNESPARNIIGNGTLIKGEIESNGDIRIDGQVVGSIRSNGKVVIGQNGIVEGEINCKTADLSGMIKGILNVEELTTMKSTSKMEGELNTKQLFIEIGAAFTGKCQMGIIDSQDKDKNKDKDNKK